MVKNPPANAGDVSSIPGSGRSSGGGNGNPLQYSCLKKSHGQRSLAGHSPGGCEESDMTEYTGTHTQRKIWNSQDCLTDSSSIRKMKGKG